MTTNNAIDLQQQGVTYYDGAGNFTGVDGSTSGFVMTSNGTGTAPSFQATSAPTPLNFDTDSGTAVPILNTIIISGTAGITTAASAGNMVTIDGSDLNITYTTDSGVASPASSNLNVFGSNGISTSGSGANVMIDGTGLIIDFVADSGDAQANAGVLNVVGSGGITTSATGDTLTIDGSGLGGITSIKNTVIRTNSPGWTPDAGTQFALFQMIGGGGGGGASQVSAGYQVSAGAGGGGGGYIAAWRLRAAITGPLTLAIGAAGAAGVGAGGAGGTGGNTTITELGWIAYGGVGGAAPLASVNTVALGGTGGAASTGSFDDVTIAGNFGENSLAQNILSDTICIGQSGKGASTIFGEGGQGRVFNQSGGGGTGNSAIGVDSFGAGGGGAATIMNDITYNGGAATPGVIIITEYIA